MHTFTLREWIKLTFSLISFAVLVILGIIAPKVLLLYLAFMVALAVIFLAADAVWDWFHKRP
jgi:hypothetical protein